MPGPTLLKNLRITRVDLVDNGANQDATGDGAHVLLYKRAKPQEEDMPKKLSEMTADELREHAEAQDAKIGELTDSVAKAQETVEELTATVEELKAAGDDDEGGEGGGEELDDEVLKGLPESVQKMLAAKDEEVRKAQERADEASQIAKAEREERLTKEYIAKAEELPSLQGQLSEIASDLRAIDENLDEEVAKRIRGQFEFLNDLVTKSALFEKHSRRSEGDPESATQEVDRLAKEMVAAGKADTIQQARTELFTKNTELAKRYREES